MTSLETWSQIAEGGPVAAQFVLIAVICATFLSALVWVVKRTVSTLDKMAERNTNTLDKVVVVLTAMSVRLEHVERRLEEVTSVRGS